MHCYVNQSAGFCRVGMRLFPVEIQSSERPSKLPRQVQPFWHPGNGAISPILKYGG